MSMSGTINTAWKNYIRGLKRYSILLTALILVSAVLIMVLAVVLGIREGIYEKASRYFAGNIVVLSYSGTGDSLIEDPETVLKAIDTLESSGIGIQTVSRRSTYYEKTLIELFFSGYYIKQRRLVGVEWDLEESILSGFDFASGALPDKHDEQAILISTAAADELHVKVGDNLLVSIQTESGQANTVELIVGGIFSETSFFGYAAYLHRKTLNRLRQAPEDEIHEIGVYLDHPLRDQDRAAALLFEEMARTLPSFGIVETREDFEVEAHAERETAVYGVVTAGAQLEEIENLLEAFTLISILIMVIFLMIVMVGVSNTFSMIVWERTREVGTLRALGMQRGRAVQLFLLEAGFLGISGTVVGLLLGTLILEGVKRGVKLPSNAVTTLFLTGGRISWILPWWGVAGTALLVVGASVLGSFRSAYRAGKLVPIEALNRHE
jgi:putative ABC transport system permease protein